MFRDRLPPVPRHAPAFAHRSRSSLSSAFMEVTSAPLTHCPICRYDLSGLPKDHHCPECGFEYDASMRVWIARPARWWSYIPAGCLSVMLLGSFGWMFLFAVRGLVAIISVLPLVGGIVVVALLIRSVRYRERIVISDSGVVLTLAMWKPIIRPWTDIWVPDPALGGLQLPPWIQGRHCKLDSPGALHLMAMIRRFFEWVCIVNAAQIFLKPEQRWFRPLRRISLGPIQQLPRKQREAAMEEIRERWERSRHQDNPEEDASPTVPTSLP